MKNWITFSAYVDELTTELKGMGISVKFDNRDTQRPGFKFAEYELKGVPFRVAIGGRDMENGTVELARRDTKKSKQLLRKVWISILTQLLEEIQQNIFKKALNFREENITEANSYEEFKELLDESRFYLCPLGWHT